MRVVVAAPLVAPLREPQPGGAQAVLTDLARGLVAAGDDVELVAPRGSRVPGVTLHRVRGAPFPEDLHQFEPTLGPATDRRDPRWPSRQTGAWLAVASRLRARPPDIVHSHALDWPAFYALAATGLPQVHTLHLGPVDGPSVAAASAASRCWSRPRFVAVSRWVADSWRPHLPIAAVVRNGVRTGAVPFGDRPQPDLALIAGRISPEKGTHLAVAAARGAGLRVLLVGPVYNQRYFDEQVAPVLDPGVRVAGPLPRSRLLRVYRRVAVAVVASLWEEPFGMVALEAALAGTPVAGFRSGGLPEIIRPRTGVLTGERTASALGRAIGEAVTLDRAAVRRSVETRFTVASMVDGYRRIYAEAAAR